MNLTRRRAASTFFSTAAVACALSALGPSDSHALPVQERAPVAEVERGWLAISLTSFVRPGGNVREVYVSWVVPDGPAALAGVRVGDRILEVNDRPGSDLLSGNRSLRPRFQVGESVRLLLENEGETRELTVVPVAVPLSVSVGDAGVMLASFRVEWPRMMDSLEMVWLRMMDSLEMVWPRMMDSLEMVWPRTMDSLEMVWPEMMDSLEMVWPRMMDSLEMVWPRTMDSLEMVWPEMMDSLEMVWPQMMDSLEMVWPRTMTEEMIANYSLAMDSMVSSYSFAQDAATMLDSMAVQLQPGLRRLTVAFDSLGLTGVRYPLTSSPSFMGLDLDLTVWTRAATSADSIQSVRRLRPDFSPLYPFLLGRNRVAGAVLTEVSPQLGSYFGVEGGLLVVDVEEGSPADQVGFVPGDVIVEARGEALGGLLLELRRTFNSPGREGTVLTIMRAGERMELTIR